MNLPIRVRTIVTTWAMAIVWIGSTGFTHTPLFAGEWFFPREQTITSARRGLTAAELAPISLDDHPQSRRTIEKMSRPVSLQVKDKPLQQFADVVASEYGLQIVVDHMALDEASVTEDQPITLHVDQIPLHQALSLALDPLDLKIEVQGKIVLLTTRERAGMLRMTVVYPVHDLVAAPRKIEKRITTGVTSDFDTLMTLLQEQIQPDSWEESGGPGRITPFPQSGALVISSTRDVHNQVEQMLAGLRQAKAIQGLEHRAIPLDESPPEGTVALASRSLSAPRAGGLKRIRRPSQINPWQMPHMRE